MKCTNNEAIDEVIKLNGIVKFNDEINKLHETKNNEVINILKGPT